MLNARSLNVVHGAHLSMCGDLFVRACFQIRRTSLTSARLLLAPQGSINCNRNMQGHLCNALLALPMSKWSLMSLKEVRSIPILFYLMKNGNWTLEELVDAWDKILVASRALHWVPIPMPMGFGWAWVQCYCSWVGMGFVHPCIQLQIGVKLLGCMEYANQ
jgi:hypothetical protein